MGMRYSGTIAKLCTLRLVHSPLALLIASNGSPWCFHRRGCSAALSAPLFRGNQLYADIRPGASVTTLRCVCALFLSTAQNTAVASSHPLAPWRLQHLIASFLFCFSNSRCWLLAVNFRKE